MLISIFRPMISVMEQCSSEQADFSQELLLGIYLYILLSYYLSNIYPLLWNSVFTALNLFTHISFFLTTFNRSTILPT